MNTFRRRGSILIVVVGMSAIVASLGLAFLARSRASADETALVVREAQARIVLIAACSYVQEASRIGWDDGAAHRETFGWIDVRDGAAGPKFDEGPDDDARFPIGSSARFPLDVMRRPPFALAATAVYNPMRQDPAAAGYAMPYLRHPDPQPAVANGWPGVVGPGAWNDYRDGDRRPRAEATGLAWFRLHRHSAARFVVTCGAGASAGWRDWAEVSAAGAEAEFGGDAAAFAELVAHEARAWYLIEWSAAVLAPEYQNQLDSYQREIAPHPWTERDGYMQWPLNATHCRQRAAPGRVSATAIRSQMHARNCGGTIRWVQRLREAPERW
ncbi:MAG TPA: hypothetical protein VEL07_10085 [Planctomycetota bacterium]|nr:hypothetical protein [Planctomycetota bacterium]